MSGVLRVATMLLLARASPGVSQTPASSCHASRWLARGALLLAAAAADVPLRNFAARHRRPGLDRLAGDVEPLGRAGVLVPTLVVSVLVTRLAGERDPSDRVARIALGYVAADAVESVLKPVAGRHRPVDGGGAWRFRPFRNDESWHSFPSAHTVHAFAIAGGIAHETASPWPGRGAFALATLVGVERIYAGEHWSSDVVGSAFLATSVSGVTDDWLRAHGLGRMLPPSGERGRARDCETPRPSLE